MPTISVKYKECLILSSAGLQGGGANKGKVIRKMFSGVNAEDLIKGQGWKCEKRGNLRGVSNNIDGRDGVSKYNGKISFEVYPHRITTISSPLGMFVKIFLHSVFVIVEHVVDNNHRKHRQKLQRKSPKNCLDLLIVLVLRKMLKRKN